jgi:hypothetical protein
MNPSDVLKYGHLTVMKTIEDVPEVEWEKPGVCGVWSVKDIIGHLAFYEHMLAEVLAPFAGMNTHMPLLSQYGQIGEAINDIQAESRKGKSVAKVREEYTSVCMHNLEQIVPKIPADVWLKNGTLPWYGMEYSLDDYIVYAFYGHKREHSAQINAFKDTLKT